MQSENFLLLFFLVVAVFLTIKSNKLTITGGVTGGIFAVLLYMGTGFTGIVLMAAFFIAGTMATGWKIRKKENLGIAEKRKGKRDAWQVLANGGIPALSGGLALLFPQYRELLVMMVAAAFSSAIADTLSSELGSLYGTKFYNIITFHEDLRGLDGVISFEGTVIGMAGSLIIAILYSLFQGWNSELVWIVVAGTIGNLADSVLGATVERRGWIKNDWVNLLNTVVAVGVMFTVYSLQFE